ncbi:uncharacterized protein LOC132447907 isoform X1 [Gadus macrocephalus]|uniref:uncharacterized protein LOC132447907 isoform X1 n=2 Tax=Gadus macrocephalus TaxID=80720 RepID=UPI0028CB7220|nr:uncharacterized protein LOC132447907 isoform X1 [Gadus macrocephalus]
MPPPPHYSRVSFTVKQKVKLKIYSITDQDREVRQRQKRFHTNTEQTPNRSTMLESHLMGFLVLLSFLPTASTIGILNSINDLKDIPFGQSVPKHSLVLLHWFANTIELTNNNRLELNFDPDQGDYGAHHYVNVQGFLDPLPFRHRYFTLGNINPLINNQRWSMPSYFTNDLNRLLRGEVLNRARIIFSYSSQDTVGQVFITQHYQASQGLGTVYDPEHTYRISINLLRELRVFSLDRSEQSELSEIGGDFGSSIDYYELSSLRNTWGQLACVGLLLFIVINQRNVPCRHNRAREPKRLPEHNVQGSATLQSYNNYRPPPQPRGEDQCLTLCLALGFLAVILMIAVAVYGHKLGY